jgi:hypothetical protein
MVWTGLFWLKEQSSSEYFMDTTVQIVSDHQLLKVNSSSWKCEMQIYHDPYAEYMFIYLCMYIECRDNSVDIETGYGLESR